MHDFKSPGYYEPQRYTWSHTGANTNLNKDKEIIIYIPYPRYIPMYYFSCYPNFLKYPIKL